MSIVERTKRSKNVYNGNEVISEETTSVNKKNNPQFFFTFCDEVARLYDLTGNEIKVLIKMASKMDVENRVRISEYDRKQWSKEIGMTVSSLNVTISRMTKKSGLVLREGLGAFRIDPEVFSNGNMKHMSDKIKQYDVHYTVELVDVPGTGTQRKIKNLKITPDKMKINPETGEITYTRRGRPVKKPEVDEVTALYDYDCGSEEVEW